MPIADISPQEIEALRKALEMTQEEFAEELGVQRTAVAHWEKGIRRPSGAVGILMDRLREKAARKQRK